MGNVQFNVLDPSELERIHTSSMEVLSYVGVKVDYQTGRDIFRQAGALVDDKDGVVRIPESLVNWAIKQAPKQFTLFGRDIAFQLPIGGGVPVFAGLGTPTHIIDMESGHRRESTLEDTIRHIKLINGCKHIHNSQMDVWPNDIPMTTIHVEAIWAWAHHSRKPFGMGCYGYLPTQDMMRMMSIAVGGKEVMRKQPRFFAICSVVSPLQMTQMQIEGMLICADYGQPVAMSPEAIAGATAPASLAGLLVQQNANILAHITLAQIFRPGAPVLYGTVSTIPNMRFGNVALGSVETGIITAGSAQLARYYGLPSRSVGGTTDSKLEDFQAGVERVATLMPAVLSGVDFITCGGTLDSTMLESDALLVMDDELCGMALRMAEGIRVSDDSLALEVIHKVNYSGHYMAEPHTAKTFRQEHYLPKLLPRQPYDAWVKAGNRSAIDLARERVQEILTEHEPVPIDAQVEKEMHDFRELVAARTIDDFYAGEQEAGQDFGEPQGYIA